MSKRHFIELADVLRRNKPDPMTDTGSTVALWAKLRDDIADVCKSENRAFNRDRWMDYIDGKCGPSGGAVKTKV